MVSQRNSSKIASTPRKSGSRPLVSDVAAERKEPHRDLLKPIMNVAVALLAAAVVAERLAVKCVQRLRDGRG